MSARENGVKKRARSGEAGGAAAKRVKAGPAIHVSLESLSRFAQSVAAVQQQQSTPSSSTSSSSNRTGAPQRAQVARETLVLVKDVVEQLTYKLIEASAGIALGRAHGAQGRWLVRDARRQR